MGRKKSSPPPEPEKKSPFGFLKTIKRGMLTILAVLIIAYGGLLLLSTTDGFRKMREDSLSTLLDVPVKLNSARINPFLQLNLKGVQLGEESTEPSATAGSVVITYDLLRGIGKADAIQIQDVEVNLQRSTPVPESVSLLYAIWNPFAEVSGFYRPVIPGTGLDIHAHKVDSEWLMDLNHVSVSHLNLYERDAYGQIVLEISDASFTLSQLDLPGKDYRYTEFAAEKYYRNDGVERKVQMEWIQGEDNTVVLSNASEPSMKMNDNRSTENHHSSVKKYLLDSETRVRDREIP